MYIYSDTEKWMDGNLPVRTRRAEVNFDRIAYTYCSNAATSFLRIHNKKVRIFDYGNLTRGIFLKRVKYIVVDKRRNWVGVGS